MSKDAFLKALELQGAILRLRDALNRPQIDSPHIRQKSTRSPEEILDEIEALELERAELLVQPYCITLDEIPWPTQYPDVSVQWDKSSGTAEIRYDSDEQGVCRLRLGRIRHLSVQQLNEDSWLLLPLSDIGFQKSGYWAEVRNSPTLESLNRLTAGRSTESLADCRHLALGFGSEDLLIEALCGEISYTAAGDREDPSPDSG